MLLLRSDWSKFPERGPNGPFTLENGGPRNVKGAPVIETKFLEEHGVAES